MNSSHSRSRLPRLAGVLALGALLLAAVLAGCGPAASADPLAAASVNGQTISMASYQHLLAFFKASVARGSSSGTPGQPTDWQSPDGRVGLADAQHSTLDFLINLELMRQQVQQRHIAIASADIARARASLDSAVQQAKAQHDPGLDALVAAVTPDVSTLLVDQQVYSTALMQNVKIPAAHLRVILVDTREQAMALEQQVEHGADFAQLARDHSQDAQSAARGGDYGTVYLGQFTPAFDSSVFLAREPEKYVVLAVGTKFALFEVTNRTDQPLSAISDPNSAQTVFSTWLSDVVRRAANVQTYVTTG
jgi:hypothetical protein